MQERYIATADLGSSKIGLCVARVKGDDVQILYYKETPSDGIRHGGIFNPKRAGNALKAAVHNAEDELKIKILQLVIALPRYDVIQETGTAQLQRTDGNRLIDREEIDMIKNMALDQYPIDDPEKEDIYGAVAQSFNADDLIGEREADVIGTCCDKIEGNFKIYIGARKAVSNIDRMLSELGIAAAYKVFPPTATAEAVLTEDEKDNGVALIEIGAGVTSVTIYKDKILRHYSSIPFGGKSVTSDIRYECGFGEVLAENIKLAYGACQPDKLLSMGDKILQINDEESGSYDHLPVKYLSEIVTARYKEIIDAILYHIQESGYADRLRNGVVITGGGANMTNIAGLVKEMSGYNVRTGYPRCGGFQTDGCSSIWETGAASSVGLLIHASKDSLLNCLQSAPKVKTVKEVEEKPVEKEEEKISGSVFNPEAFEKVQPQKTVPKKEKEKAKTGLVWIRKVKSGLEKTFDVTVGNLYDGMDNNN